MKWALAFGKDTGATYGIVQTDVDNLAARRMFEKAGLKHKYVNYDHKY